MQVRNGAELLKPLPAIPFTEVTAGGSGDATKITGLAVDRLDYGSGLLVISGNGTIGNTETVSLEVEIQDCDTEGGTYETAVVLEADAVVLTASGALTNKRFEVGIPIGLAQYKQWVKLNVTPNLSASGTDTLELMGSLVVTDGNTIPEELEFEAIV